LEYLTKGAEENEKLDLDKFLTLSLHTKLGKFDVDD
jgi:hypothetical protein